MTVIEKKGSSPEKQGSRMFLDEGNPMRDHRRRKPGAPGSDGRVEVSEQQRVRDRGI